jgi:hypothetical protein
VGPRTDLDDVGKRKFFTVLGLNSFSCRPAHSQSLYGLYYPGYLNKNRTMDNVQKHNNLNILLSGRGEWDECK